MDSFGDHNQKPRQPKGILKNAHRPQTSSAQGGELSAADKLSYMVERFAADKESRNVRPRNTNARKATACRPPSPETQSSHSGSRHSTDLAHRAEPKILDTVPGLSMCEACWRPLGEFEGYILRDCQQHIVCKLCLYHEVQDARKSKTKPTCPADNCRAVIKPYEIECICSEDQADTTGREAESSQKLEKRPTSSAVDDSEEIDPPEELLESRENETSIVAKRLQCDKCEKPVTRSEYLDIRNCKMHHRICFECIRAAVKISKNLVRCPLYRHCKSMMARDEVQQVKYDIKQAEDPKRTSSPKSKAKAKKLIYPDGLPSRVDLWPVLGSTKCSKCSREIDVLTGIVLKQCNVHCVCVKCVREKIAQDRKLVECPMYISCKSMMTEDEVDAFIERFGGPSKK